MLISPDKRWMRREAERALASYGRPLSRPLPRPVHGAPNVLPPVVTEPEDREMALRITCQCGRVDEVQGRPADLITRRLRCLGCGKELETF